MSWFEVVRKADNIILKLKKVTLFEISNARVNKNYFSWIQKKKKKKEEGIILEIGGESAKNADTSHVLRRGER